MEEALFFIKNWRLNTHKQNHPTNQKVQNSISTINNKHNEDYHEDSLFELELKNTDNCNTLDSPKTPSQSTTIMSLAPPDTLFKRKILPIQPTSKTQPSISLPKPDPKFGVFMLQKSKTMRYHKTEETKQNGLLVDTQKLKRHENKLSSVKFNVNNNEDSKNSSLFTRDNSLRRLISEDSLRDHDDDIDDIISKRFSKQVFQKYLKLINPLYIIKHCEKSRFSGEFSSVSSSYSPASSLEDKQRNVLVGKKKVHNQLEKSKLAITGASSPAVSRRDDSLLLQQDGIQSAILHCKKSFNSSRGLYF